jgi:ADP-ribose pyrophosphatase YjhB (NUDIX family)
MDCDHSLIADVALVARGRVLLVRYKDVNKYDHQPGWFLPDDSLRHLEHPDKAAKRILGEQLGIAGVEPKLHHVESFKGNDGSWHLPFHYLAELADAPKVQPSEDVAEAEWFSLNELPPKAEVAHHGWALTILARMHKEV